MTETRVQRRQRETREHIFRVAMELFRQKGFEQTTVAEITEAADIGKGTFFTYFPTKEAIFGHLGAMMVDAMTAAMEEGLKAGVPIPALLERQFAESAAWHEANRPLTEMVALSGLRQSAIMEADAPNQWQLHTLLARMVQAGQSRDEFTDALNAEDAATALLGLYFTVVLKWVGGNDPRPLSEQFAAGLAVLMRGLRP